MKEQTTQPLLSQAAKCPEEGHSGYEIEDEHAVGVHHNADLGSQGRLSSRTGSQLEH